MSAGRPSARFVLELTYGCNAEQDVAKKLLAIVAVLPPLLLSIILCSVSSVFVRPEESYLVVITHPVNSGLALGGVSGIRTEYLGKVTEQDARHQVRASFRRDNLLSWSRVLCPWTRRLHVVMPNGACIFLSFFFFFGNDARLVQKNAHA